MRIQPLVLAVALFALGACGWNKADLHGTIDVSFERGSGCPSIVDIDVVQKRDADEYGIATTLEGLRVVRSSGGDAACEGTVDVRDVKVETDERYTLRVVNSATGEMKYCGEWYMVESYFGDGDWQLSIEDCWAGHDDHPRNTDHQ